MVQPDKKYSLKKDEAMESDAGSYTCRVTPLLSMASLPKTAEDNLAQINVEAEEVSTYLIVWGKCTCFLFQQGIWLVSAR